MHGVTKQRRSDTLMKVFYFVFMKISIVMKCFCCDKLNVELKKKHRFLCLISFIFIYLDI